MKNAEPEARMMSGEELSAYLGTLSAVELRRIAAYFFGYSPLGFTLAVDHLAGEDA